MTDRIESQQTGVQDGALNFVAFEPGAHVRTPITTDNESGDQSSSPHVPHLTIFDPAHDSLDVAGAGSISQSGQDDSGVTGFVDSVRNLRASKIGFFSESLAALRDRLPSLGGHGGSLGDLVKSTADKLNGLPGNTHGQDETDPAEGIQHAARPALGAIDPTKTGDSGGYDPAGGAVRVRPLPTDKKPTVHGGASDSTGGVIRMPSPRPFPADPTKPTGSGTADTTGGSVERPMPRPRPFPDPTKPTGDSGAGDPTGGVIERPAPRPLPTDSPRPRGKGGVEESNDDSGNGDIDCDDPDASDIGIGPIAIEEQGPIPDLADPPGEETGEGQDACNDEAESGEISAENAAALEEFNSFLEENFQQGPIREVLQEFGRQVFSGDIDPKKLSDMMQTDFPMTKYAIDQARKGMDKLNELLKPQGIRMEVGFGGSEYHGYQMFDLRLSEITEPGKFQSYLSIEQNGDVSALEMRFNDPELKNIHDRQLREIEPDQAAANLSEFLRKALSHQ
ncbi:MAG: hypothetical protein K2Z81_18410 [Cyanobacteria bacterium]|nr:hypothetical protein [Cyanobacteriota bacterium]